MKTDNELVAEGLHPKDVAWLEGQLEKAERERDEARGALREIVECRTELCCGSCGAIARAALGEKR